MAAKVLLREHPNRAIALVTDSHTLVFRHSVSGYQGSNNASTTSLTSTHTPQSSGPRCIVELLPSSKSDLSEYRTISYSAHGTLGLVTLDGDVYLCVVSGAIKAATVRPGENVMKILSVDFHCLNRTDHDHVLNDDVNYYHTEGYEDDVYDPSQSQGRRAESAAEHPCLALKKLLSGGSFYYSVDFDLTNKLQERSDDVTSFDFGAFDAGYLWNSYMIKPLVDFRSRLSNTEKLELDSTRLLTSAIRGFALTMTVPASSSPGRSTNGTGLPSTLTLISRLSCLRAGTRFNARGIDDDGNVANFVETETILWSPSGFTTSYVQVRGSIPLFWEQAAGLLPGQQKIQITRSPQATQPAFDKHFQELEAKYSAIHIVNLLSKEKTQEIELSNRYSAHVARSSLNTRSNDGAAGDHRFLRETDYDFHAETRGPGGYEAASMIKQHIRDSAESFGYCLVETTNEVTQEQKTDTDTTAPRELTILQQHGIFRTNCLDCLDRTNLVQTIISLIALEDFCEHRSETVSADLASRHRTLWADNGDALSRIYAGTGALKSSFTRSGKMSLAGALADARKCATRMYINNFADKGRQTTIDLLLGRLIGQTPVYLFDPISDYVQSQLALRSSEFTTVRDIQIWCGTLNLNGRVNGIAEDLSSWLCPKDDPSQTNPHVVAVGFQEMVELSPQQIMSTEPKRRQEWERAVKRTLNAKLKASNTEDYVLLRGGQLVGASLSIFVRRGLLHKIKNVEASLKKTGMSGMAGNKGAVAIRFEVENTSLCFVTAHLAAGFANYEERNHDYKTISQGLRFQRNRSIEDHQTIIWLGDFNYRIGLGSEKVRSLIADRDFERLYENDQLNLQMVAGLTFPHYSEARIFFQPTYRYDVGTNVYDSSEKNRIPAWCDRILRKGNNLRQHTYATAPLMFSDHRPVYATFTCTVEVVDAKHKDELSESLYDARRTAVGGQAGVLDRDEDDDEDLIGYESIEPGLPPASSDRKKWWLENGQPARSKLQPPTEDHIPNPNRPSNPFTPSEAPDWIIPLQPQPASPLPMRSRSTQSTATSPAVDSRSNRPSQLSPGPGLVDGPSSHSRPLNEFAPPPKSGATVTHRKPAPPRIPAKPRTLTSPDVHDHRGSPQKDADKPPTKPPRPTVNGAATGRIPARRPNQGLMDDDDDDDQGMGGWTPLMPS